jgi:hypothetical protein
VLNRRSFLGALGLTVSAPAIVKADNLMKISVQAPEVNEILPGLLELNGARVRVKDYPDLYRILGGKISWTGKFRLYDEENIPERIDFSEKVVPAIYYKQFHDIPQGTMVGLYKKRPNSVIQFPVSNRIPELDDSYEAVSSLGGFRQSIGPQPFHPNKLVWVS